MRTAFNLCPGVIGAAEVEAGLVRISAVVVAAEVDSGAVAKVESLEVGADIEVMGTEDEAMENLEVVVDVGDLSTGAMVKG